MLARPVVARGCLPAEEQDEQTTRLGLFHFSPDSALPAPPCKLVVAMFTWNS
jgi:hypothetical protein